MLTISRPLFVYMQRPDTGEWVTVGRYLAGAPGQATFKYAPSYVDAGLSWSIDPVNLPFLPIFIVLISFLVHDAGIKCLQSRIYQLPFSMQALLGF